jgi:Concanavalin A-like lectin/glucanases superfamily
MVSDTSYTGSINPSTNPLLIGKRNAQDGREFAVDGRLDKIAIWDRELTASEISFEPSQSVAIDWSAIFTQLNKPDISHVGQ